MKISITAVTALLLVSNVEGFTTSSLRRSVPTTLSSTSTRGNVDSSDVSIPYDAAAKLAYDQWRAEYNKGEGSDDKFERFCDNYKVLTVANISAAKKAKDAGEDAPKKMDLNAFADMSFEEYEAMNSGVAMEEEPKANLLETVMAGSKAQEAASASLVEAAAALAKEEQVR